MSIKFLKSLLLSHDHYLHYELKKWDVMKFLSSILSKAETKSGKFNMIESTVFEFINLYATKIYKKDGLVEFQTFVKQHQ